MAPIASAVTRVLVTGFGPFGGVPDNPSWGIASRLPSSLPNNIELIVHPSFVKVAYHPVIDLVPELIAEHQPDIALHMGVAAGRTYFAVEQTSQKDGYQFPRDVDGEVFTVKEIEEHWGQEPAVLSTDIDLQSVVAKWQNRTQDVKWPFSTQGEVQSDTQSQNSGQSVKVKLLEDVMNTEDVRWSDSVGTYLCGFIYYTDLVQMKRTGKNQRRDVAFMHVPSLDTEDQLEIGVEVTKELIQSLVETWRDQYES